MRHDPVSKWSTTEEGVALRGPAVAAHLLAPRFAGLAHEELRVLYLDRRFVVIDTTAVIGGDSVVLPIARIVREALGLTASAVLIAHNHPGADSRPSRADHVATVRLARALKPLSIVLADHLVFGEDDWTSFRRSNWL